jgi:hypothetical protein
MYASVLQPITVNRLPVSENLYGVPVEVLQQSEDISILMRAWLFSNEMLRTSTSRRNTLELLQLRLKPGLAQCSGESADPMPNG